MDLGKGKWYWHTGQGHQRVLVNSTNNPNCKCLYPVNTKYLIIYCLQILKEMNLHKVEIVI